MVIATYSAPTNADLLSAVSRGDDQAWTELVDRYGGLLWSIARSFRLDPADAADAVQIAWLRLVENLDRIVDPDRLPGWLATTVRRECLRLLRRSGREQVGLPALDLPDDNGARVDRRLLLDERDAALCEALDSLPRASRQLLQVLMGDPRPTYALVSQMLGIPIGSIGPARRRALDQLRHAMIRIADRDLRPEPAGDRRVSGDDRLITCFGRT